MNKSIIYKAKEDKDIQEDLRKLQALQKEPCEDAISRQAVLDLLENTNNGWIIDKVLRLPSVNPQKIGHWTIKQYHVPIENKQVPTVSGITFPTEPTACKIMYTYTHSDCRSEEYLNKFNYCPNCGAKMIESEVDNAK